MSSIKENLKEAYNNYALDPIFDKVIPWQVEIREQFLRMVQTEKRHYLLDIGAGNGSDSRFFLDQGLDILAIDLSFEMVKQCREKGVDAYELDLYDLHKLPLPHKFDAIWAMNSLIHVEKQALPMVLGQIQQLLKPSGLFFMGVYGGADWEGTLENDIFQPARHFSFYPDEKILEIVTHYFHLVSFATVPVSGGRHFQSIFLRKEVQECIE